MEDDHLSLDQGTLHREAQIFSVAGVLDMLPLTATRREERPVLRQSQIDRAMSTLLSERWLACDPPGELGW